jgi:hypothetical protein
VHLVTAELDAGPIILQATVPVRADDTVETLSARILVEEHRLYPEAIALVLDGGWKIEGRRFRNRAGLSRPAWRHILKASSEPLRSVSTATSGGQLMRTGTLRAHAAADEDRGVLLVPTPASTGNLRPAMAPTPARPPARRGVPRQHQLHVELRGLSEAARIVRQRIVVAPAPSARAPGLPGVASRTGCRRCRAFPP